MKINPDHPAFDPVGIVSAMFFLMTPPGCIVSVVALGVMIFRAVTLGDGSDDD